MPAHSPAVRQQGSPTALRCQSRVPENMEVSPRLVCRLSGRRSRGRPLGGGLRRPLERGGERSRTSVVRLQGRAAPLWGQWKVGGSTVTRSASGESRSRPASVPRGRHSGLRYALAAGFDPSLLTAFSCSANMHTGAALLVRIACFFTYESMPPRPPSPENLNDSHSAAP
jgi:hypothetical protein